MNKSTFSFAFNSFS